MKSIQRRYKLVEDKFPLASSFIVFSKTISGQHFTRPKLSEWFKKLVDKNDYDSKDLQKLITHLYNISNVGEQTGNLIENDIREEYSKNT